MLKNQIQVGGLYQAKVSGVLTTVRVEAIRVREGFGTRRATTVYDVTNLRTNRKTTFNSATKFRGPAAINDPNRTWKHDKPEQKPLFSQEESLASKLRDAEKQESGTAPHLIIAALAGTGKTTTLIEGLKIMRGLKTTITPSPQQKAVWESLALSKDARRVCFAAFNRSIANELKTRVPEGCEAMTMHGLGNRAIYGSYGKVALDENRVEKLIVEMTGTPVYELRRDKPVLLKATKELVNLCKMNLSSIDAAGNWISAGDAEWPEILSALASHYDIDLNHSQDRIFDLVPRILERCRNVQSDRQMDYSDMVWIPVVNNLHIAKYDVLLVDECQDLNKCQQALAKKAGHRLILCGDTNQAIYGFAGADAESMLTMESELKTTPRGCKVLPLTVTRRCGTAIVEEAKKIVPSFEAHENNGEGTISRMTLKEGTNAYSKAAQTGDMVLCRVTAPLVSQCFRFIANKVKANIQGRNIGQGLISTIEKMKASSVAELQDKVEAWYEAEEKKENAKKFPSEQRLIALQDRRDCILCFCEDKISIAEVIAQIEEIFTDNKVQGILLSTIHKAKGLEAARVFLLEPEGATVPHPMARTAWQKQQEWNLRYVAITRAIRELVYVS